ncbi:MAG: hypothetical protein WCJ14_12340 [Verrucomicrobiota bacterium]
MSHAVVAQVDGVKVASGVFGGGECGGPSRGLVFGRTLVFGRNLARRGLVVTGGGDEVAVSGVEIEVIQALEIREGIGHRPAHVGLDLRENVAEQREPTLALEAFKKGGQEDFSIVAFGEILKKVATALKQSQTPADASFEPKGVGEGGAVPTEPGMIEKTGNRLEEFATDD